MTWADAFAWATGPWWAPFVALAVAAAGAGLVTWATAPDLSGDPTEDDELADWIEDGWEEEDEWFI